MLGIVSLRAWVLVVWDVGCSSVEVWWSTEYGVYGVWAIGRGYKRFKECEGVKTTWNLLRLDGLVKKCKQNSARKCGVKGSGTSGSGGCKGARSKSVKGVGS